MPSTVAEPAFVAEGCQSLGRCVYRLQTGPAQVATCCLASLVFQFLCAYMDFSCSVLGGAVFHEPIVSEGSGSMVIVRDIEFASTSEADLLPFYGRCHVAYVPSNGVVLGLSKLARVTKLFARRLQSQQRLTSQILVGLQQELAPKGAAIVMEARHLAHGPEADFFMSSASSGCFQDNTSSCMQARLAYLCHSLPIITCFVAQVGGYHPFKYCIHPEC